MNPGICRSLCNKSPTCFVSAFGYDFMVPMGFSRLICSHVSVAQLNPTLSSPFANGDEVRFVNSGGVPQRP